ncbi:MAG: hypothetical protein HUU35_06775 [Armatimonadetes bacterium]|nr:hypothetical protein [Armatimonadota bacterium]
MSRQIALDTIHLRPTPRLAHTEYSLAYHHDYIRHKTGLEPNHPEAMLRFQEAWGIDFLWGVNDGLHGHWLGRGRATDMGHAEYASDGSDKREPAVSPFQEVEEVWAFDAVAEYGLPDFDEQVAAYQAIVDANRRRYPEQLCTGGYYKTIVSGAIQAFGWEMLLLGASDPARMERVFDSIYRFTRHHMEAWARTDVEVIIQHDDFVWTLGPFMRPDYYREVIIARFAELWKPLKAAGKKVLFCSDGNFMELAEDLVAAGADGLIFEPCNDFEWMVDRFGDSTLLMGSAVDCRTMTFGTWEQVRAEMDLTLKLAERCQGLVWAVGNHLPPNISEEMMEQYITYLLAHWQRPALERN